MGTIRFVRPEDKRFETTKELVDRGACPPETLERMPPSVADATAFIHHPGGPDELQLLEVRHPPNTSGEAHAHANDEIMVVIQGEMVFGSQRCPVGSTIYIPRFTLYSFDVGPEGATFLNFRKTNDQSYIPKDELVAARRDSE